jgi:hypothetical protein
LFNTGEIDKPTTDVLAAHEKGIVDNLFHQNGKGFF